MDHIANAWTQHFWSPSFWLQENVTWSDLKDTDDIVYPKFKEIFFYPLLYAFPVFFIRYIIER